MIHRTCRNCRFWGVGEHEGSAVFPSREYRTCGRLEAGRDPMISIDFSPGTIASPDSTGETPDEEHALGTAATFSCLKLELDLS